MVVISGCSSRSAASAVGAVGGVGGGVGGAVGGGVGGGAPLGFGGAGSLGVIPFRESRTGPRKAQEGPIPECPGVPRSAPECPESRLKPLPPKIKVSSRTTSLIRPSGVG